VILAIPPVAAILMRIHRRRSEADDEGAQIGVNGLVDFLSSFLR